MEKYNKKCRICKSQDWFPCYTGAIRTGKFGTYSPCEHTVWQCRKCGAAFLDRVALNYETAQYRCMVDGGASSENFYALHDDEQIDKINVLGTGQLRGKVIADVGCGAGSFLDLIKGYAATTIAIEPAADFHKALKRKNHKVYGYAKDALKNWRGKVDIIVSFAVLEHIEFPLEFLKEIRLLLKPRGMLLLSTPNHQDWMLEVLAQDYGKFFYRQVHAWYFDEKSLTTIGKLAGFKRVEVNYKQRFDFSNALLWARDRKPTGLGKIDLLRELDGQYEKILETQGRSDFIYGRFFMEK